MFDAEDEESMDDPISLIYEGFPEDDVQGKWNRKIKVKFETSLFDPGYNSYECQIIYQRINLC